CMAEKYGAQSALARAGWNRPGDPLASPRQRSHAIAADGVSDMPDFETRPIGRTALRVTVLGLGCATLGGRRIPVSREGAEAIVRAAWKAGVRYVDAAPYYGFGQAERCVGDALRAEPRSEWVLSTKVGRLLRPIA